MEILQRIGQRFHRSYLKETQENLENMDKESNVLRDLIQMEVLKKKKKQKCFNWKAHEVRLKLTIISTKPQQTKPRK